MANLLMKAGRLTSPGYLPVPGTSSPRSTETSRSEPDLETMIESLLMPLPAADPEFAVALIQHGVIGTERLGQLDRVPVGVLEHKSERVGDQIPPPDVVHEPIHDVSGTPVVRPVVGHVGAGVGGVDDGSPVSPRIRAGNQMVDAGTFEDVVVSSGRRRTIGDAGVGCQRGKSGCVADKPQAVRDLVGDHAVKIV